MGTLYVVGAPAGKADDLTYRGLRLLGEVVLVVANDTLRARELLDHLGLATPVTAASSLEACLVALAKGDVALLGEGELPGPSGPAGDLVRAAIERGFAIVSAPGPSLPISALAVSGLPADSFVYLGELPQQPALRTEMLASVRDARRTLVLLASPGRLKDLLTDLYGVLGERPMLMAWATEQGEEYWRGTLHQALDRLAELSKGTCALVVGGTRQATARWPLEQLQAAVRVGLSQGLGAREIGRQLAAESGWSRREVYRLALDLARPCSVE